MITAKSAALVRAIPDATAEASPEAAARHETALGALRGFVTVLVVAHHAVLAYHPFAPPPPPSLVGVLPFWRAFPVVDAQRFGGFAWLVGFNDTFFMSLMFFLSGLFVWSSLRRRGGAGFMRERGLRLGVPFVVAAALLAPLAYFPAYLQTGAAPSLSGFARQWLALGDWPSGPVWFIWLLLAFDGVAAAWFALRPRSPGLAGKIMAHLVRRPVASFGLLVTCSATVYVPMALHFDPMAWSSVGPFSFQTSRLLHYAVYFFAGVVVGATGIERSLLAAGGRLAARWPLWILLCAATFGGGVLAVLSAMAAGGASRPMEIVLALSFVLACAAACFGFLSLFVRFFQKPNPIVRSLTANAYGMFILHYAVVSWLQYLLLPASASGLTKGLVVFGGALALTWGATAALRRIPAIARVL